MTESNGIYPTAIRRHEDDCKACLDPLNCDCLCNTCRQSREDYYNKNYTSSIRNVWSFNNKREEKS